jgi:protein-S-isoprenylcysteine O-methyltransferase Ste14
MKARVALNSTKFLLVLAVVLFASAGTLRFWQVWVYLGLQLAGIAATSLYLLKKDPALLERRLTLDERGEKEKVQRIVMALFRLFGLAMLIAAGLDRRFGWSSVPHAVVAMASIVFAAGTLVVFSVFRENSYTSSIIEGIIEVDPRQTVVATGPYRVLRHPMYAGTLLMGLATPLVLGSYWAELFLLPGCALLVVRLLAEERLLAEQLQGYKEYMNTTRSRLVPGVW